MFINSASQTYCNASQKHVYTARAHDMTW